MDHTLNAISPVDGRYLGKLQDLTDLVSESALIKARIKVEAHWLLYLAEHAEIQKDLVLTAPVKKALEGLSQSPADSAALKVKEIEATTNHDVKAVEYYIREVLLEAGADNKVLAFIHFACTSEDINNLSYGLILKDAREKSLIPTMDQIISHLSEMAVTHKETPMLSRTHGQTASPTTLGKECAVFAHRLQRQRVQLESLKILGKMNGAVGNYNAHLIAYPTIQWHEFSKGFIKNLGLEQNPLTTQIENHDSMVEYFDCVKRFNTILIGFCRDIWSYISIGYFRQKPKEGEVGSSTMPHKVNPIDFENAEGNLGIANSLLGHFAEKLPISRWQRDLSDSTVQRAIGPAFGHSVLAYKSCLKGLHKLHVQEGTLLKDLDEAWEVLGEAVQTVLRRYGAHDAYEQLKKATRGQSVTKEALHDLIDSSAILPQEVKQTLKNLHPKDYTGCANILVESLK